MIDRYGWTPQTFDPLTPDEIDEYWDAQVALDEARRRAKTRNRR